MQEETPKPATEILRSALRGAFRVVATPFAWPADALRRSRASRGARSALAERGKFDTREWTAELLKHLEWRRFEEVCAAYFAEAGTASASTVYRFKAWDAYRIGIKAVRELRAAMSAAGTSDGVLVTSGRFTFEAVTFAAQQNIQLIDGAALLARFAALPPEKSLALLKLATQGDFLTPTCPQCSVKMTSRKSTQGGRKFWGCVNYPRCKHTVSSTA